MLDKMVMESLILNFQKSDGTIAFQSESPPPDGTRYYIEMIGAQSRTANRQYYWFTDKALAMLAEQYSAGLSLLINHETSGSVGVGESVNGEVKDKSLYIVAYLLEGYRDSHWDANQLIAAVKDGFLKDVSLTIHPLKLSCSICGNDYTDWRACDHFRGRDDIVEDENGNKRVETCYVMIDECEGVDVSLVYDGADTKGRVTRKGISLSRGFTLTDDEQAFLANQQQQPQLNNGGSNTMPTELQAQLSAVQAELTTVKAQLAAKESEVTSQATTLTLRDERITALETEVAAFKTKETENAQLLKDGEEARKEAVDAYCQARVKFHGVDYKPEMREADERFAKAYPLSEIKFHIEETLKRAKERYPEGAEVDTGTGEDEMPQQIIVPNPY